MVRRRLRDRGRSGRGLGLGRVDLCLGLGDERPEGLVVDDLGALGMREHEPDDEDALERVVCARSVQPSWSSGMIGCEWRGTAHRRGTSKG